MITSRKTVGILISAAAFSVAAPALADRGSEHARGHRDIYQHNRSHGHAYRPVQAYKAARVVYAVPPVVYGTAYGPPQVVYARPPVVYAQPRVVYAQPQVVYAQPQVVYGRGPDLGAVIGAVAGALIGNQIGHGGARIATTAAGAILGGAIGNRM